MACAAAISWSAWGVNVYLVKTAPHWGQRETVLAYYERPSSGQAGRVVKLQTDNDSDVLGYWDTEQAYYDVTLWGVLPEDDWAIDVTFAFSGSISVSTH